MNKSRLLVVVCVCLAVVSIKANAFIFTPLGALQANNFHSSASDVSGDGSVTTGSSRVPGIVGGGGFYWTQSSGMVNLGPLPNGQSSGGGAISLDGNTIVGSYQTPLGREAFRWTSSEGYVGLGEFAGGQYYSTATGVSGDGSHIVGHSNHSMTEAFLWTEADEMQGLGDLAGGLDYSVADAISSAARNHY